MMSFRAILEGVPSEGFLYTDVEDTPNVKEYKHGGIEKEPYSKIITHSTPDGIRCGRI